MEHRTRYARSGGLHITYQVVGDGDLDVVLMDQWFSNAEARWDLAPLAKLLTDLASFSWLIVFDKRGTGLSDPVAVDSLPALEQWMDDLRAVLDDSGSERAALVSGVGAAYMALLFAATYPERTSALVLVDPCERFGWAPDYPWGMPADRLPGDLEQLRTSWGGGGGTMNFLAPGLLGDPVLRENFGRYERQPASPGSAVSMIRMLYESEVRDVLPAIRVPTLVLTRAAGERVAPVHGRYIAERIEGAAYMDLPGSDHYLWAGDSSLLVAEIEEFLTGVRPAPIPDRVLATVLFTDMVGDGFLATFDGPARAVRCAQAISDGVRPLGIEIRAGLHTGEIELAGDDVRGIAVRIGTRVATLAGPGEVLVSSTVKDLVVGSGIEFEDRGVHQLKGVPGEWRLFAALDPHR
jgi:pimeloyl-ACP methyl ester carboxylesterase